MKITSVLHQRIYSIDLLRGIVMIIMALDHVRDYFHADNYLLRSYRSFTRQCCSFFHPWFTHFSAPVFMFLAGTSAFLVSERKTKKAACEFFIDKGALADATGTHHNKFCLEFQSELSFLPLCSNMGTWIMHGAVSCFHLSAQTYHTYHWPAYIVHAQYAG